MPNPLTFTTHPQYKCIASATKKLKKMLKTQIQNTSWNQFRSPVPKLVPDSGPEHQKHHFRVPKNAKKNTILGTQKWHLWCSEPRSGTGFGAGDRDWFQSMFWI